MTCQTLYSDQDSYSIIKRGLFNFDTSDNLVKNSNGLNYTTEKTHCSNVDIKPLWRNRLSDCIIERRWTESNIQNQEKSSSSNLCFW